MKISIVTPCYNMAEYLEETILSVINQPHHDIEYIIIDGGSTDGSQEIIKKYAEKLAYWTSEPDEGMYQAIQKGFDRSSGDVMGWINADDILLPGCCRSVAKAFSNPECLWLRGLNAAVDYDGRIVNVHKPCNHNRYFFLNQECFDRAGNLKPYGTIQQEGTFWRRNLWTQVGGLSDNRFRLAGDFYLWMKFFRFSRPFADDSLHAAFRWRKDQLSAKGRKQYEDEMRTIIAAEKEALTNKQRRSFFIYQVVNRVKLLRFLPIFRRFYTITTRQVILD